MPTDAADDEEFTKLVESSPEFITSQLHAGQVLSEGDVAAIQAILSKLDSKEEAEVEAFHDGRIAAFRELGGEDLVTAVQLKDSENTARIVRKAMDRMYAKERMTRN